MKNVKNYYELDKEAQRGEYLKRNEIFKRELNELKQHLGEEFFSLKSLFKDYQDYDTRYNYCSPQLKKELEKKNLIKVKNTKNIQEEFLSKIRDWKEFCNRWFINENWDSNLETLSKFTKIVELYRFIDRISKENAIFIKVGPWTSLKDIKTNWKKIESKQREYWGAKYEKKAKCKRDLIWYDLSKQGYKVKQIAREWIKNHRKDIDILVVRRLRKTIPKEDFQGKVLDDKQLLKEIQKGFLSTEYAEEFKNEKNYFLTGKIENKNGNKFISTGRIPFEDVIKKAIKRVEKQIDEVTMPSFHPKEYYLPSNLPYRINLEKID